MSNLEQFAKQVTDRESFVRFVAHMATEIEANPQAWENCNLASFLEAMARWIEDMDGFYKNQSREQPANINWTFMADAFMAARIYE
jgi:hypothetical protein